MKYKEIQDLTNKELKDLIEEEQIRYVKMKLTHKISPLDNPMKIRETRRKIARLKTELRIRQLNENK
ncbi:MAG TPA: 50S ribosomal protein L29 [Bacteroidia bacterium]|jgi:large subunit ribosomal protein L29|nr:50S ribosomal protein L29 [Sphingobacteriales bacterium]HPD65686.1 50S ribosomal protein L29 [Bacteroidia bacterium]HRS59000.1 50S ribosomal protein L29 [Bacteroidia bacterium]HRU68120.1 50S ribosomal protein L29 [Bacteroidia bacterium]